MYTCITCSVAFKEAGQQRDHYKTDWHRYNLKRKVAEMSPVSLVDFEAKMAKHDEKRKELEQESSGYCVACSKHFSTVKAYENHLKSKKHVETAKKFELKADKSEIETNRRNRKNTDDDDDEEEEEKETKEDMEVEEVDSDEWEEEEGDPVPANDCLFCGHHSANQDKCLGHMSEKHSFFLPDPEYLVDTDRLLEYLCAKVGQGRMCLWCCNDRKNSFRTLDAVRKHMLDKGHCKINFHQGDAIAEFADFYDYSSSYPEAAGEEEQEPDQEVDVDQLDDTGYQLVLPSGATIGHRSLMRYYRQSLNPNRELVVRKPNEKLLNQYRSFGWTGLTGREAKVRAKDIKKMRAVQQKYYMKLGMKANNQKYWRDPTL